MHNHVVNRGRKAFLKQIFSVFLIFTLYFNSFNSAYASTSLGGWTITSQLAQGASTVLNASKTAIINGANVLKTSTAKITPNASQVAKVLRGGAAGYALSIAVEQLLGSVDWVLDPTNNQIVYKPTPTDPLDPRNQYYYQWYSTKYSSLDSLCIAIFKAYGWAGQNIPPLPNGYGCRLEGNYVFPHSAAGDFGDVGAYRVENSAYNLNATVEEKKLSLDVIAAQVISNAESSTDQQKKAGAQAVTTAAAQDMLANDVTTQNDAETQLNTNAKTQTTEAVTGTSAPSTTNPQVTNISLSFPVFCGWAPMLCEAAQTVIKFPQTITEWWNTGTTSISDAWTWTKTRYEASVTSISDFFKNEPDQTDNTELPTQDIPTPQLETNYFRSTPGCPEPIAVQIKIGVEGTSYISYEPICQFASKWSFIAPLIGFLSGAMIIVGVGRKSEDSDI